MGWPVVTVANGGLPVTDNNAQGYGVPVEEAANGMGTAITYVASGGMAIIGGSGAPSAGNSFVLRTDGSFVLRTDGSKIIRAASAAAGFSPTYYFLGF